MNVYTVAARKRYLRLNMLSRSRILCFLCNNYLIFIHFLSKRESRRQRRVSGRTLFHPFKLRQCLRDIKYLSLIDCHIPVHIP